MTGQELRGRRAALGLSQAQLGTALGVPSNTIARWERGELTIARVQMLHLALQQIETEAAMAATTDRRYLVLWWPTGDEQGDRYWHVRDDGSEGYDLYEHDAPCATLAEARDLAARLIAAGHVGYDGDYRVRILDTLGFPLGGPLGREIPRHPAPVVGVCDLQDHARRVAEQPGVDHLNTSGEPG